MTRVEPESLSFDKPLLLLDVDGVLIPWQAKTPPSDYQWFELQHRVGGTDTKESGLLSPSIGTRLLRHTERFQLVWATGWEHEANRVIAPILGLPELPVIEFPRDADGTFVKLVTVSRIPSAAAVVWVDDELTEEAKDWARTRPGTTMLIDVDPGTGITHENLDRVSSFGPA
jgi:hypothetical protein